MFRKEEEIRRLDLPHKGKSKIFIKQDYASMLNNDRINSYDDVKQYSKGDGKKTIKYSTGSDNSEVPDMDYWKTLPESSWIASFNLSMNNYFFPLKAKIAQGTPEDNAAYTFDKETLKLTVNQEVAKRCLTLWLHMNIARTEVLLALRNVEGFEFVSYLSSLSNEASRARDKVLYRIIEVEKPEYKDVFKAYETFASGKPFEGYVVHADSTNKWKSLGDLICKDLSKNI
ncbi:hypothetical protein ACNF40_08430 [Cuniculiplasma sp. SKW4]|uniref:hypothetical protein n=1 Tax=Cuniculiplasma sp. SKW4 TaxID=3400171 RepID=UPI003FD11194